jgi:Flp pilus assembly protein TadG
VQRLKDERGAVAVMVALLMVPLIGFAAIAIDVAGMYSEQQQLQTGADAAAFAIAQNCNRSACGDTAATAQNFSTKNINSSNAYTASVTAQTSSSVTVQNGGDRKHWFAPVLGIKSNTLSARATVNWGSPTAGTALLPLAFSWCEWKEQTGGALPSGTTSRLIYLSKTSGTTDCTGPSNNVVPGGFGWVTTDPGTCHTTSSINGLLNSDPGKSMPSSCSEQDLVKLQGTRILLPVFDSHEGNGSGATYRVFGYAAFVLTGYYFGNQNKWNSPCNGNDRCIRGYFTKFVDSSEAFTVGPGGPQLGGSIISLTQ